MASILPISDFIDKMMQYELPILDVRSEGEFDRAHIPGAVNLPLLKNEERIAIGTLYKKKGREDAVKKGFELVGLRFANIISEAEKFSPLRKVLLYCWRGGMRSNITAWLLNMSGFQVFLLKGGYKSYRTWAQQQFHEKKNIIVIGGTTGSGKTALIKAMAEQGEQIVDIEGIANHKGSAFGALGQAPQPTTEHFENILALQWFKLDNNKILWIENESRSVGSNIIPGAIYEQMREAQVIEIILDKAIRKKRILEEYGIFSLEVLAETTKKVAKRLGGLKLKEALAFLEEGNLNGWLDIMMDYYDKTYEHGNLQREKNKLFRLELNHDRMNENASFVLQMWKQRGTVNNM